MENNNEELQRLRAIEDAGMLTPEDSVRLNQLRSSPGTPTPPAKATPSPEAPATSTPEAETFIPLNTESFDRGGKRFWPPPEPKIYPAVCEGVTFPDFKQDQCWFIFRNAGDAPSFKGNLVTGNLRDRTESSGAFKVKDILEALEADYRLEPGQGVYIKDLSGKPCQVEWQWVDLPKGREMRIQNIYPAEQDIEQL